MTAPSISRPIIREIAHTGRLAIPLVLSGGAQMAINTVDVLILGRYSVNALAASALAVNLMWAFAIFGIGVVVAVPPLVSAERGRNPNSVREVRRTVRQGMWASVVIVLPMWLALWHARTLFTLLGQEPALAEAASDFVRIAMWGILPFLGFVVLRGFVVSLERPTSSLLIAALGVVFNIIVCSVLVFGFAGIPALGLHGAAIANALSSLFLFLGLAAFVSIDRRFRRYRLFGRWWHADWPRLRQLLALGLPIGITLALEVTIFNVSVFLMGQIGRAELAAHAVAIQIASLAFQLPLGISQAATVRVGLSHGRGDAKGIAIAGHAALWLGLASAILLSIVMALGAHMLVGLFIEVNDPATRLTYALAVDFLMVAALFQLFDGAQSIGAGLLRGIQDTRWPMAFAAFGYWIVAFGVAEWLGFNRGWGGLGIWVGLASGLGVVAILMLSRWLLRARLGLVRDPAVSR